jgi:hypothetical protein
MSQRLAELHRQRRLVEEHLAWLDREIAAELIAGAKRSPTALPPAASDSALAATVSPATTTSASATGSTPGTSTTAAASAVAPSLGGSELSSSLPPEALIDEFRTTPDAVRDEVRKGCFLYLALAFGLLIAGIAVLYFLFRL